MNIGIFTDTYFPQVSGVATSIKTLKDDLERKGNSVYIFTTTDPHVPDDAVEPNVFRFTSVPFVSFTDRRVAVRGMFHAYHVAKELNLDIVHTQTEFSMGYIGKFVARQLKVPTVHTYHTMYESYLHYIMNGHLLRPYHVKQFMRAYLYHVTAVITPSDRAEESLQRYGVKQPISVIPTGVDLTQFKAAKNPKLREQLGLADVPVLLSLSRVAYEKRIDKVIDAMPAIVEACPEVVLLVVGDGPAREDLEKQTRELQMQDHVRFIGEVDHSEVPDYYRAADIFVSASDSESQGLTYIEALAAGRKVVAFAGEYTNSLLDDPAIGTTFTVQSELVHQVVNYLKHPQAFDDPAPREVKLRAISADLFGDRVLKVYQDATRRFQDEQTLRDEALDDSTLKG
ncbi:glycosyltransferase family 4 protein [Lacticaseibacillus suilingensis]|jgi:1,2-diacylglycerol 3-alpha-glucosyltransferase|uniref:Glycosyltransferase family 4 protein n=1 Tax=Lacticaseibacillus suilingensis TaxID=2799577 RepID=A0ABW4BI74_9LACO|nr:glycosyltransferase family 4 protein [Lacticaseibacillus suilingensis]MCI1895286.1 glycosyltransferase family 4 protein [Lactobacillus sp.]MCI1973144.1 glycosyltransferase family 4 protein [Lactobacillus sp.]